jgi:hypothetical protein
MAPTGGIVTDQTHPTSTASTMTIYNRPTQAADDNDDIIAQWNDDTGHWEWLVTGAAAEDDLLFYNNSGEEVPAYAIMAVTGVQELGTGEIVKKIAKPSTTFYREYIVNGSVAVANSSAGIYQKGPEVLVAYDTGTPAVGEGWGPKPGQWTISKNYPQTCCIAGITDAVNKIVLANLQTINEVIGKLDTALSQGSLATVNVWAGAGNSEFDTNMDITAYDWLMYYASPDIASGKKVVCRVINGCWYVTEAECPNYWNE